MPVVGLCMAAELDSNLLYPLFLLVFHRKGSGNISASGGSGLAGGGGGRVSVDVFSRHDDTVVSVHGI